MVIDSSINKFKIYEIKINKTTNNTLIYALKQNNRFLEKKIAKIDWHKAFIIYTKLMDHHFS